MRTGTIEVPTHHKLNFDGADVIRVDLNEQDYRSLLRRFDPDRIRCKEYKREDLKALSHCYTLGNCICFRHTCGDCPFGFGNKYGPHMCITLLRIFDPKLTLIMDSDHMEWELGNDKEAREAIGRIREALLGMEKIR